MEQLFHGSYNDKLTIIKEKLTLFDGLFTSYRKTVAESHGNFIYKLEVNEDKILNNYALNYELDHETVKKSFIEVTNIQESHEDFEKAWECVVEGIENENTIFSADTYDSSWEAQRLRGQLAKSLGYDAVEMKDEHGTSYLVLNASIEKI